MIQACNQKYRKILFRKILSYLACSQIWLSLPSYPMWWLRFPKSSYTNPYVYYTRLVWYGVLYGLGMYVCISWVVVGGICWVGETRGK
jgi:hypothetical protein